MRSLLVCEIIVSRSEVRKLSRMRSQRTEDLTR